MDQQHDITRQMRAILVDWYGMLRFFITVRMCEVCLEFDLQEETFYLAVNYVDRYLSLFEVPRNRLQLLGVTALFVAM